MAENIALGLRDGTLVRHRTAGYEGKIEGTTAIKTCFTKDGNLHPGASSKEVFQYRVAVAGADMRYIAPLEDLEVLAAAEVLECAGCGVKFFTRPGAVGKAGGRCACGGWICSACWACQSAVAAADNKTACSQQRKRLIRKLAAAKKK